MELTEQQRHAISEIDHYGHIQTDEGIHKNTLNALEGKGIVVVRTYANGDFYELTEKGDELIDKWIKESENIDTYKTNSKISNSLNIRG